MDFEASIASILSTILCQNCTDYKNYCKCKNCQNNFSAVVYELSWKISLENYFPRGYLLGCKSRFFMEKRITSCFEFFLDLKFKFLVEDKIHLLSIHTRFYVNLLYICGCSFSVLFCNRYLSWMEVNSEVQFLNILLHCITVDKEKK